MAGTQPDPGVQQTDTDSWHTLTDLQILALLAAAPVDGSGANPPRPGSVTPAEHFAAKAAAPESSWIRPALARVLGLPPPPSPGAALRMRVEWGTGGTEPDPGAGEDGE